MRIQAIEHFEADGTQPMFAITGYRITSPTVATALEECTQSPRRGARGGEPGTGCRATRFDQRTQAG